MGLCPTNNYRLLVNKSIRSLKTKIQERARAKYVYACLLLSSLSMLSPNIPVCSGEMFPIYSQPYSQSRARILSCCIQYLPSTYSGSFLMHCTKIRTEDFTSYGNQWILAILSTKFFIRN